MATETRHGPMQTPQFAFVEARAAGDLVVVAAESGQSVIADFRVAAGLVAAGPAAMVILTTCRRERNVIKL